MNRKILKAIKILAIILIIALCIFSLFVSQDKNHLDFCHNEHCAICAIIQNAQNIVNSVLAFIISTIIGVLIYFFLSRLHKKQCFFVKSSLVFQKIQLNE